MCENAEWIEIGEKAVWWTTTAKPGNGVEFLRDDQTSTYWQSDGHQPHLIDIKFEGKVPIVAVHMYLDFRQDESYTPSRVRIRAGNCYSDLKDLITKDFHEPVGWQRMSLQALREDTEQSIKAKMVQIAILSNHQNGKDSHVRQIKIFGPKKDEVEPFMKYRPAEDVTTPTKSPRSKASKRALRMQRRLE